MPITPFLGSEAFDPETRRIMSLAFDTACIALGVADRGDRANEPIADSIIELAKAGERNPDVLCERALARLRGRSAETGPFPSRAPGEQAAAPEPKQEPRV